MWYNSVESCYQSEMMIRVVSLAIGIVTSEAYYLAKLVQVVGVSLRGGGELVSWC